MNPEHFAAAAAARRTVTDASERRPYLWSLEQVSLYGRRAPRLHPVTMQLHTGCTAVIGYSGAGKTSLLNLLVGFEKPDGGTLTRPAGRVFWAPQNGGLWPHLTVREHFLTVRPGALPKDLLRDFDLAHKLDSRPDELSEGEQSRLSVARALWSDASVLVMDEPLVHVDPARAEVCWRAIRRRLTMNLVAAVISPGPRTWIVEGAGGGLVAAVAYDLYRLPFVLNGAPLFKVFALFGKYLTGTPGPVSLWQAVGWTYHFSNGAALGIMFLALVTRPTRAVLFWGAVAWALFVEGILLLTPYARFFGLAFNGKFIFYTASAHAIFGLVLGIWCSLRLGRRAAPVPFSLA